MPYKDKEKQKIAKHESYLRNKENNIKKRRKRRHERKKIVNKYKEKKGCVVCGEKRFACLVFHHRNKEDKKREISYHTRNGTKEKEMWEEIKKCNVMCANCHMILHHKETRSLIID